MGMAFVCVKSPVLYRAAWNADAVYGDENSVCLSVRLSVRLSV